MKIMLRYVALAIICAAAGAAAQNIGLDFNSEIVLWNTTEGSFTVTAPFEEAVAAAVREASQVNTITSKVYSVPPHLVVLSNYWSSGTSETVEESVAKVEDIFDSWREDAGATITSQLNQLTLEYTGRQPSLVDFTDSCQYVSAIDSTSPTACLRNLSVTFYTSSGDGTSLKNGLCAALTSTDCNLIQYTGSGFDAQTQYTTISYIIASKDRNGLLVSLVNYATYASVLSSTAIAYIMVNGVQVYFKGNPPQLSYEGTTSECVAHFWYLIFLIILVPLVLIASQRFYEWGRESGKRSVQKSETDIRAGVHLSANPWAGYGNYQNPPPGHGSGWGVDQSQQQQSQYARGQSGGGAQMAGYNQWHDAHQGWGDMQAQQMQMQQMQMQQVQPRQQMRYQSNWQYNGN